MSAHEAGRGPVRIGELSRRVGVTPEVLRAWSGYGIPSPTRTDGGFRLSGEDDERRIRRLLQHLEQTSRQPRQLGSRELTRRRDLTPPPEPMTEAGRRRQLRSATGCAMRSTDSTTSARISTRPASYPLESVLRDAFLPYLHELGERWAHAEASIAQDTSPARCYTPSARPLARDWGRGRGLHALLACVPGDQHDLGLICFGLALRAHGWRITYLGADTPLLTLIETADSLQPALVVFSAAIPELAQSAFGRPARARLRRPLALAGRGTDASIAESVGW